MRRQTPGARVRFGAAMSRRLITALLLAGCLSAGLVACGGDDDSSSGDTTTVSGPQRSAKDVDVGDATNTKTKPSVGVPDGKPPKKLEKLDLVDGTGAPLKSGDKLKANYVGLAWSTGQEFDASWDRGETIDVEVGSGGVIPGWDRGLIGMRQGGRRLLVIPPDLAYGAQGQSPTIGPNETLVFVIDAVKITPSKAKK
jgi:peptidylprolyl isomerase